MDDYADQLAERKAGGFSTRDAKMFAGKGIRPSREDEDDEDEDGLPSEEERRLERAEYIADLRRDREADSQ